MELNKIMYNAVVSNDVGTVVECLRCGASGTWVDARDRGMCAAHVAAEQGNYAVMAALLDAAPSRGDMLEARDNGGWTPLHWYASCSPAHLSAVSPTDACACCDARRWSTRAAFNDRLGIVRLLIMTPALGATNTSTSRRSTDRCMDRDRAIASISRLPSVNVRHTARCAACGSHPAAHSRACCAVPEAQANKTARRAHSTRSVKRGTGERIAQAAVLKQSASLPALTHRSSTDSDSPKPKAHAASIRDAPLAPNRSALDATRGNDARNITDSPLSQLSPATLVSSEVCVRCCCCWCCWEVPHD